MPKYRITDTHNITARNIRTRMICTKLHAIHLDRLSVVVLNFDKMLEIGLPLLIILQAGSMLPLTRRKRNDRQLVSAVCFDHNDRPLLRGARFRFAQIVILGTQRPAPRNSLFHRPPRTGGRRTRGASILWRQRVRSVFSAVHFFAGLSHLS